MFTRLHEDEIDAAGDGFAHFVATVPVSGAILSSIDSGRLIAQD